MIETLDGFKIGDWVVLVEDHYQPHAATIRLTLEHFRDKKTTVFPLLYHEPIPIIHDILDEDFGFTSTETENGWLSIFKCKLMRNTGKMEDIEIHIMLEGEENEKSKILIYTDDEVKISLPIKYIHEYQHILSLCGLEQLEKSLTISEMNQEYINFIIEKKYYKDWNKWKKDRDNG